MMRCIVQLCLIWLRFRQHLRREHRMLASDGEAKTMKELSKMRLCPFLHRQDVSTSPMNVDEVGVVADILFWLLF